MTEVSPDLEVVAWADSCLNKDPDLLDNDWDSLKDALLETLRTSQYYPLAPENGISPETTKMEVFPGEDADGQRKLGKQVVRVESTSVVAEEKNDGGLNAETTDDFWSSHKVEDVFLHTYDDNLRPGVSDPEVDLVFQAYEAEQTNEGIFKIWDLDIPPEEDGLTKQLNKALSESSLEPTLPVGSDDTKALKGLPDVSVDNLVARIAELALSPNH